MNRQSSINSILEKHGLKLSDSFLTMNNWFQLATNDVKYLIIESLLPDNSNNEKISKTNINNAIEILDLYAVQIIMEELSNLMVSEQWDIDLEQQWIFALTSMNEYRR
jgi:hypothetical protein